jgi:hypothetical protein
MFGSYQPCLVDIGRVEANAWAPIGFYDPHQAWPGSVDAIRHPSEETGGWKSNFITRIFYLPWLIDSRYVHNYWPPNPY